MRTRKTRFKSARSASLVPLTLFIVLVSLMVIERILVATIFVFGFTCDEQRSLFVGASGSWNGLYNLVLLIGALALIVNLIDWGVAVLNRPTKRRFPWVLRLVNCGLAVAFLTLASKPWAHFHVGHPVSNALFQIHNSIHPGLDYIQPSPSIIYLPEPESWDCISPGCEHIDFDNPGVDYKQVKGIVFRHRRLGISVKIYAYYTCYSPAFNIAIDQAYNNPIDPMGGDKRRYVWVYFDPAGRYIPHPNRLRDTVYLRSHLTEQELEPTDWTYEDMIWKLYSDYKLHAQNNAE